MVVKYQTMMYRPTVRCIHHTRICKKSLSHLFTFLIINKKAKFTKFQFQGVRTRNIRKLSLTLPLYLYLYCPSILYTVCMYSILSFNQISYDFIFNTTHQPKRAQDLFVVFLHLPFSFYTIHASDLLPDLNTNREPYQYLVVSFLFIQPKLGKVKKLLIFFSIRYI